MLMANSYFEVLGVNAPHKIGISPDGPDCSHSSDASS